MQLETRFDRARDPGACSKHLSRSVHCTHWIPYSLQTRIRISRSHHTEAPFRELSSFLRVISPPKNEVLTEPIYYQDAIPEESMNALELAAIGVTITRSAFPFSAYIVQVASQYRNIIQASGYQTVNWFARDIVRQSVFLESRFDSYDPHAAIRSNSLLSGTLRQNRPFPANRTPKVNVTSVVSARAIAVVATRATGKNPFVSADWTEK